MNTQAICFVIVTYKPNGEALRRMVQALACYQTIVVDNTAEVLSLPIKDASVIHNNNNLGFAGGVNVGIRKALKLDAQWIVVVNQDIDITHVAIENFCKKLVECQPGIAGPFAGRLDQKRWTTMLPALSGKIDYISGACIAIHKSVVTHIGLFYEPYFMYYEDVEYCIRAKNHGFPLTYLPNTGIDHRESVSLGRGSYLHTYYLSRNHLLFTERNAPVKIQIHELLRFPKTIWEHIKQRDYGAVRGIRDYMFRRFGNLH